jgi:regulator of nucleoside diphosphate kinase
MTPAREAAGKRSTTMSERTIHITTQDRQRLQFIQQMTADADRHDLVELVDELNRAVVVRPEEVPPDVVTMNSRVRLRDLDRDRTFEYTLVYPADADAAAGKVSVVAPIGAAMIGYRAGDELEWRMPDGRQRRFRVEAVLYQPEAAGDRHL